MKLKSEILAQLNAPGFLGTGATLAADFNLIIQLLMGVALLLGMILARRRHYRAHAICQGSVVLLNLVMIASIMLPPFVRYIVPGLAHQLSQPLLLFPNPTCHHGGHGPTPGFVHFDPGYHSLAPSKVVLSKL